MSAANTQAAARIAQAMEACRIEHTPYSMAARVDAAQLFAERFTALTREINDALHSLLIEAEDAIGAGTRTDLLTSIIDPSDALWRFEAMAEEMAREGEAA